MKNGQSGKVSKKPRSILRSSAKSRFNYNENIRHGQQNASANQGLISSYDTDIATVYKPADPRRTSSPSSRGGGKTDDPFRARGLGGLGKNVPQYSDSSMNYLDADRDLSPLRAEYSLSPLSHDLSSGRVTSPPPYTPTHSNYHGNTFTGPSYLSSRDQNSNILSPKNELYGSELLSRHTSRDPIDLNKSSSTHYSDSKTEHNRPFYGNITDTPRVRRVRDNNLRQRMTDDNGNAQYKPRSHSAGDPLEGGFSGRDSPRTRTPSAPANLNHSAISQRDTPISERVIPQSGNHSILSSANRSVFSRATYDRDPVLSRSIMSGEYRVRDPNRSALSSVSMRLAHENDLNRSNQLNYSQSLTRDPVTHRKISPGTPNGAAKLLRDQPNGLNQSKHSLDLSKTSLNHVTLFGAKYGVMNSLVSLIFLSFISLAFAFVSAQLLFNLTARTATGIVGSESESVLSNSSYENTHEVTIALTTFVLMLDVCCLLVCSMQFFFAAKLAKCPQGDERCFKYLKECAGTRFIAVTGFFVSIPVLLLALMLYMLMEYHATSAIIAVVILSVGITFAIIAIVHSTYFWRVEKNKADLNIPAYEKKSPCSQSELSTLV